MEHGRPYIIEFPYSIDDRGTLCFIEQQANVPFDIKRVFYITDVPKDAERGGHAHKTCHQVLIAINGSVTVVLSVPIIGDVGAVVGGIYGKLDQRDRGLYVPPGVKVTMSNFSHDAVLLVLASDLYDRSDYV